MIVYTPFGNAIFATRAFDAQVWVWAVLLALAFGVLEEIRKWLLRR